MDSNLITKKIQIRNRVVQGAARPIKSWSHAYLVRPIKVRAFVVYFFPDSSY